MSPTEILGIALLLLSVMLFLLEVKAAGVGVLGVSGAVSLVAGLWLLGGVASVPFPVLVVAAIPLLGLLAFLAVLAHRARRSKVVTGNAGMIGLEGRAETDLLPDGKVLVRGELWSAWSPIRLERGQSVRVIGVRGLRLEVSAASQHQAILHPRSVVEEDD